MFSTQSVNNPNVNLAVSLIALAANVLALGYILLRAKKQGINPWTKEVFKGTKDYEQAIARADEAEWRPSLALSLRPTPPWGDKWRCGVR